MINERWNVYVGGVPVADGTATIYYDRFKKETNIFIDLPKLKEYHMFLEQVKTAPSIDYVMNTWGRHEPTQD